MMIISGNNDSGKRGDNTGSAATISEEEVSTSSVTEFDEMINSDGEKPVWEHSRFEMSNTSGGSQSECKVMYDSQVQISLLSDTINWYSKRQPTEKHPLLCPTLLLELSYPMRIMIRKRVYHPLQRIRMFGLLARYCQSKDRCFP